jgi:hypothetical protein
MADIPLLPPDGTKNLRIDSETTTVTEGQRIVCEVLNADGSLSELIYDGSVPADRVFPARIYYEGMLSDA